jgi:hypothetical protein
MIAWAKARMSQAKSKHRLRQRKPQEASPPERFFQRELAGEDGPAFEAMKTLFVRAGEVYRRQPWDDIQEVDLVMFEHPVSGEPCFCSVMGAMGEAMAVQVYIGVDSYLWFQDIHAGAQASFGDFLANQYSVFVNFVMPDELGVDDRELAKRMNHPLAKNTAVPVFRTIRPGYHPWFMTETEVRTLVEGLEALLAVGGVRSENADVDFWREDGVYPLVRRMSEEGKFVEYSVQCVKAPTKPVKKRKVPQLDQPRIESILGQRLRSTGILDVDHFYGAGMIGEEHERKACFRLSIAIDSKSGFAFPPQISAPQDETGDVLQGVVLKAIETKRALPVEIHVLSREFKILLAPLAKALAVPVKVKKSLPALEFAKSELENMLGAP